MKAVVIDDEKQSHKVLNSLLSTYHPELKILGSAYNVKEGIELIRGKKPGLIFLDIDMPDGTGFDLLENFTSPEFQVIFITAHNEYALPAIQFGALAYLMKPLDREELKSAIEKAFLLIDYKDIKQQLQIMRQALEKLNEKKPPKFMAVATSKGTKITRVEDIMYIKADGNYTEFILDNETKKIYASNNIGEFEKLFSRYEDFMKIHRSNIVNLNYVDSLVKADGGYVQMTNRDILSVARSNKKEMIRRIAKI